MRSLLIGDSDSGWNVQLGYDIGFDRQTEGEGSLPLFAGRNFKIRIAFSLNGWPLSDTLVAAVAASHATASWWSELALSPELEVAETPLTFIVCFPTTRDPLMPTSCPRVDLVNINATLHYAGKTCPAVSVARVANVALQTIYVNLEDELPFIFSVFGRRLWREVMPNIERVFQTLDLKNEERSGKVVAELAHLQEVIRWRYHHLHASKLNVRGIRNERFSTGMIDIGTFMDQLATKSLVAFGEEPNAM